VVGKLWAAGGQPVGNRDVVHQVVHGTVHSLSTTPIESKF
jgi:hypothetical protein